MRSSSFLVQCRVYMYNWMAWSARGRRQARVLSGVHFKNGNSMRPPNWLLSAIFGGLLFTGCAGMRPTPNPEVRQALAPTGKLRVGLLLGTPTQVIRDSASGEMKGVGYDLGKEFARRLGIPFEPVIYSSIGALLDGGKSGNLDVAFIGFSPERTNDWDYTAIHLEVDFGYLIPDASSISTQSEVDRPGVRVAVPERSLQDIFFSRTLKSAEVVRASSLADTLRLVQSGKAEAMGNTKPALFAMSLQWPGSRVLDGRPGVDPQAMAMPKGRDLGVPYARKFVEESKSEGLVKAAMERVGLRGASVAPLQ